MWQCVDLFSQAMKTHGYIHEPREYFYLIMKLGETDSSRLAVPVIVMKPVIIDLIKVNRLVGTLFLARERTMAPRLKTVLCFGCVLITLFFFNTTLVTAPHGQDAVYCDEGNQIRYINEKLACPLNRH